MLFAKKEKAKNFVGFLRCFLLKSKKATNFVRFIVAFSKKAKDAVERPGKEALGAFLLKAGTF